LLLPGWFFEGGVAGVEGGGVRFSPSRKHRIPHFQRLCRLSVRSCVLRVDRGAHRSGWIVWQGI